MSKYYQIDFNKDSVKQLCLDLGRVIKMRVSLEKYLTSTLRDMNKEMVSRKIVNILYAENVFWSYRYGMYEAILCVHPMIDIADQEFPEIDDVLDDFIMASLRGPTKK